MKGREFDAVAEELENVTVILKNLAKKVKELENAKANVEIAEVISENDKKFKVVASGNTRDYRVIALSESAKKYIETKYPCDKIHMAPSVGELMQISETEEGIIKADLPLEKYQEQDGLDKSGISQSAVDFFATIENNANPEMDLDVTKVRRGKRGKPKAIKLKDVVVNHARGMARLNGIFDAITVNKKNDEDVLSEEVVRVKKNTFEDRALSIDDELAAALSIHGSPSDVSNKPESDILNELSSFVDDEDNDYSPFAETMAINFK